MNRSNRLFIFAGFVFTSLCVMSFSVNALPITKAPALKHLHANHIYEPVKNSVVVNELDKLLTKPGKLEHLLAESENKPPKFKLKAERLLAELNLKGQGPKHGPKYDGKLGLGDISVEAEAVRGNSSVPEPSSLVLFTLGLLGLGLIRHRQHA